MSKHKRAKKEYYKSQTAKDKWDKKKQQRKANKLGAQQSEEKAGSLQRHADNKETKRWPGFPEPCIYLIEPEKPGETQWCKEECNLRCPYSGREKETPTECPLPLGRILGEEYKCWFECKLDCPHNTDD